METPDHDAAVELRASFDHLIDRLVGAREAIDNPELLPPPGSARNLAEGYRYLLGTITSAVERALIEDPECPVFRQAIPPHAKSTWDNADTRYMSTRIDQDRFYRVTANPGDATHWYGAPPIVGDRAPCYVIFSAIAYYPGDSGSIAELMQLASIDSVAGHDLALDANGCLEILIGPYRPSDYEGNYLATRVDHDGGAHDARYLICRQLFGDWEYELPFTVEIQPVEHAAGGRATLDPAGAAAMLRRAGDLAENQMRFWNEYFAVLLDGYGRAEAPLPSHFLAPNQLRAPRAPRGHGPAQETNIYSGGTYDLGPDEALVITQTTPEADLLYSGINISNIWGESFDYALRHTSLNHVQAIATRPDTYHYVVAHRDPGLANWLDTLNAPQGLVTQRWVFGSEPKELPTVTSEVVPFVELGERLAGAPPMTPDERSQRLAQRDAHCQRRFSL